MKPPPLPDARSRARRILACAGLVATVLGASGCSSSAPHEHRASGSAPASGDAPSAATSAGTALRKQAAREKNRPVESARSGGPIPGVESAAIAPVAPADIARARTPTPEAVAAIAQLLPDPRQPAPRIIDEATQQEALRAYVSGRAARLNGDLDLAMEELERSAKLNPNPPEPWREIAEVHLARGDRHGAEQAFQRSFERDPTDPRVLERTALLPVEGRASDAVAGALARLESVPPDQLDPAMRYLVPAGLGRVLIDRGYIAAGVEMLARAATLPTSFGETTAFREALSDLYRRRGELYRDAGDGLMRIGETDEALALYEQASRLPLLDPDALLGRRVAALMTLGQPSQAAVAVIDSIGRRGGQIREWHVALLQSIAASSDTGPAIVEALREDEAQATPQVARTSRPLRVQAIAAILPPQDSRAFLREEIVLSGGDAALIDDLYTHLDASGADTPVSEAILLASLDPLNVDRFVDGIVALGPNLSDTLAEADSAALLPGSTEAARALVRARVLVLMGRFSEALAVLESAAGTEDENRTAALARIRVLVAMGRFEDASAALDAFDPGNHVGAIVGKAALLADQDRSEEAVVLLDSIDSIPGVRPWEQAQGHLTKASILTGAMKYTEAAAELHTVLALDPGNEYAHAGLIALYVPNAPLADEARLVEVLRSLRDTAPDSRTFRLLRARDAFARGRPDLAEKDLVELANERPDDPTVVELLITVWTQQDRTADAEAWLRERLVRMPGNRTDVVELAKLMVRTGRAREASALLGDWLTRSPADATASRTLETIYRDELQDPAYASKLARERLSRTPVSIDTLGELAVLQMHDLEIAESAATTEAMLELAQSKRRSIGRWGDRLASLIAQLVHERVIPTRLALKMLADLTERAPDIAEGVLILRMHVVGRSETPVEQMIEAAELAGRRYPALRDRAFYVLMDELRSGQVMETRFPQGQIQLPEQRNPVRRPADTPQGARDNADAAAGRNALAVVVADHLRATRPAPVADLTAAYALDAANRAVILGRKDIAPRLGVFVDEAMAREDRDQVFNQLARLSPNLVEDPLDETQISPSQRADVVASLSNTLHALGDDDRADALSRLALRYDPQNVSANNNFGYRLLQRDADLDDALAMIEVAFRQEPDAPHIIDSMAWALYKAGVVHDEFDDAGNATRLGAVTLMNRALRNMEQDRDTSMIFNRPILLDHLGDAQWAAGDHAGAEASWREALRTGEFVLTPEQRKRFLIVDDATFAEIELAVNNLRQKVTAIETGTEPPISPILRPVNTRSPFAEPPAEIHIAPPTNSRLEPSAGAIPPTPPPTPPEAEPERADEPVPPPQ